MGLEEEIEAIEEEIAETPYNKSTEQHIGRLKAKLAAKKEELEKRAAGSGGGGGFAVAQHGDATVALVGFPSVGKSTLLNALTNADSETGAYEFTTLDVTPGMLEYRGANIQLLDIPGMIEGAAQDRGGGQAVLSVVRTADLVLFVVSAFEIEQYERLRDELYANNVRLDTEPVQVTIRETQQGGLSVTTTDRVTLDSETIKAVCREYGYVNADVTIREDLTIDQLVDALQDNRAYVPSAVAVNKVDLLDPDAIDRVHTDLRAYDVDPDQAVFISATEAKGLDSLKETLWADLGLIRIYLDHPTRGIDRDDPLILTDDANTVDDALRELGGRFDDYFRFARVTGPSAKHDGQQVGRDHELHDEDILRITTTT